MRCDWDALTNLLPIWMRPMVDKRYKDSLQEIRLRVGSPPVLLCAAGYQQLPGMISGEDLQFVINTATRYSPWSSGSVAQGFITAQGGHRIGLCGTAVIQDGRMLRISEPTSLCLRVARDFPGIADRLRDIKGSVLILGKPGWGKTTLLRDLIRQRADSGHGPVCVIDERCELFPAYGGRFCFPTGLHADVLRGCGKLQGIETAIRNMSPATVAVDEITASGDCRALHGAGWCGVDLLASVHAETQMDLMRRPIYRPLVESGIFETCVILHRDKSWHLERMNI